MLLNIIYTTDKRNAKCH